MHNASNHKRKLACAVSGALLAIGFAEAADIVTEDVKVTATRVEKELMDVNMSVSVLTAEDIRRSSARSVGELLEMIPGVRVNNDGGQGIKRVSIRGNDTFQTLVMIDGQKISEQKSMSGSPFLIDPSQIERIEVIKGPASVLYGSEAIGGAVNIITKKGGTKAFGGEASVGFNTSANGRSASAAINGASNGWHWRLSAGVEANDELETPAGDMENTYFNSRTASAFVAYDINPDVQVGGRLDYYDLEFGSGDVSSSYDFAVDVPKWTRAKGAVFAEMKNVTDSLVRLRTDAFFQRSKKDMLNTIIVSPTPAIMVDTRPNASNTTDQYGFSVQADWQIGDSNYLVTGYEFGYDDLSARSTTTTKMKKPGMPMPMTSVTDKSYDGWQMTHAVFASMETALPADFTLNYGVRYTWVKSEMDERDLRAGSGTSHPSTSDGKAVFNAGILWNGIEDLTLRAAYSQGYRFPLLQHLYVDTAMGQSGSITKSNSGLKAETSDNFEIGARWMKHGVTLDATVFYSDANDFITTVRMSPAVSQYQNIAKAKTVGLELAASWAIADTGFEPYASLTWLRREYDNNGVKTTKTGSPNFYGRYGLRWSGDVEGIGLHTDAYAWTQSASDDGTYRYGGATTFNLTSGLAFGPQKLYTVDAGFYNIGDKLYQNDGAIYEPSRYFAVKFNARY